MPSVFAKTPLKFLLLWTVATVGSFLVSLFWIEIGEQSDVGVIQAALGGLAIALPQSFILRETIFCVKWVVSTLLAWILLTAIGVGAMGWVVPDTESLPTRLLFGTTYGAISGFVIGLAQWTAVRQPLPLAWQWIFISSASWAVAVPIGSTMGMVLRRLTRLFLGEVLGLAFTWLVVAILTGINAYKLLR